MDYRDIPKQPVSSITDGWKLKDGCLYVFVKIGNSEYAHIIKRNGCQKVCH